MTGVSARHTSAHAPLDCDLFRAEPTGLVAQRTPVGSASVPFSGVPCGMVLHSAALGLLTAWRAAACGGTRCETLGHCGRLAPPSYPGIQVSGWEVGCPYCTSQGSVVASLVGGKVQGGLGQWSGTMEVVLGVECRNIMPWFRALASRWREVMAVA